MCRSCRIIPFIIRYMEQTVAKAIIASMTSCSDFKPKYPYVNAHKSALLYVGYHLKGTWPGFPNIWLSKYWGIEYVYLLLLVSVVIVGIVNLWLTFITHWTIGITQTYWVDFSLSYTLLLKRGFETHFSGIIVLLS